MTPVRLALWFALALLLATAASRAADDDNAVLRLDRAEIVLGDTAEPPGDSADWQPVELPDHWHFSRPASSVRYGWYRLRFDRADLPAGRLPGVYLTRLRTVGAVYLNGERIGQNGEFGVATTGVRPSLYALPAEVLRDDGNVLHVRVWAAPGSGGLSVVKLGDQAVLQRDMDRTRFRWITLRQLGAVAALTLGAVMLLIWSRRRHEAMYGYLGLAALALVVEKALFHGDVQPVPPIVALPLADVALYATPVLSLLFALRFAGWHWPRTERVAWCWAALSWCAVHATLIVPGYQLPYVVFGCMWLLPHYAGLALMLRVVRQSPSIESVLLTAGHLLSVLALTDFVVRLDLAQEAVPWYQVHLLPMLTVMAWIVTRRFVGSLEESESLNRELEGRVAGKHAELERQYARTRELEREQAVVQERARLMSDMHDGVGAQLISTLSLVEHGEASKAQVAAALRECIDDLRLAIDSLEPADGDLAPVLGGLRYRLEPRLKAAGIALDWQVRDLPTLACLTPQNVLHVLRILQEAFANVLKHARADRIAVETGAQPGGGRAYIRVRDNGRGFAADAVRGHGLASMRRRAQAVGGELNVQPAAGGTTLELLLPVG